MSRIYEGLRRLEEEREQEQEKRSGTPAFPKSPAPVTPVVAEPDDATTADSAGVGSSKAMSRIYEGLRRLEEEREQEQEKRSVVPAFPNLPAPVTPVIAEPDHGTAADSAGVGSSKSTSRTYDNLRRLEQEREQVQEKRSVPPALLEPSAPSAPALPKLAAPFRESVTQPAAELDDVGLINLKLRPALGLVALAEPKSLGAEKFRALATRLDFVRRQNKMRSFQVISSMNNEGKTFVSANLALTFAKYSSMKVLLLEGDLHRPTLSGLLGQSDVRGISHWWSNRNQDLERFVARFDDTSLWFLAAGTAVDQPSEILQSAPFVDSFRRLAARFDWIVVDSTPMLPVIDANLWSRLVDGTLLVVREGVASVKALQKGLESLDNLRLIGAVINGASDCDLTGYGYNYRSLVRSSDSKAKLQAQ